MEQNLWTLSRTRHVTNLSQSAVPFMHIPIFLKGLRWHRCEVIPSLQHDGSPWTKTSFSRPDLKLQDRLLYRVYRIQRPYFAVVVLLPMCCQQSVQLSESRLLQHCLFFCPFLWSKNSLLVKSARESLRFWVKYMRCVVGGGKQLAV